MISLSRLEALLPRFAELKIALVGDLFLDRYLELAPGVREMSIETGLEAYQIPTVRNSPGALGTVMNNLAALGVGKLMPVTVIGDDGHGYDLMREVRRLPVDERFVIRDERRLTPTYTKPMQPIDDHGSEWRELNRLDIRTRGPISAESRELLCQHLDRAFAECDGLIVCDQVNETDWGVVGPSVRDHLAQLARRSPNKLVFVDSRAHMGQFTFGTLKPNRAEALSAIGRSADDPLATDDVIYEAVQAMVRRTGRAVFCTLSERGILVATPSATPQRVPAPPVRGAIDIVGAGDSATAGMVASLLCGASEIEAAAVGNLVASITIEQLGTTGTATPAQVLDRARASNSW